MRFWGGLPLAYNALAATELVCVPAKTFVRSLLVARGGEFLAVEFPSVELPMA